MKSGGIQRSIVSQDVCKVISLLCVMGSLAEGCIVTAPSLVRLETEETVLVINSGSAPKTVTLKATDYPSEARLLFSDSFILEAGGEKLVFMKLDESKFSAEDFQANRSKYISLKVQCDREFDKAAVLLLSPQSGYLFLETDRPVYKPNEIVHIRVLAIDEEQLPTNSSVVLEIKRNQKTELSFHVEDYVSVSVSATYELSDGCYVAHILPKFGVLIEVPAVLLPSEQNYEAHVKAKYVYGKPVKGTAIITVYVRNQTNHDVQFSTRDVQTLVDGNIVWNLPVSELKNGSHWQSWVTGNRLSLRVAVVEEATGKQEAAVNNSAVFSNSKYSVSLEHARRDFKPGTSVIVMANVRRPNGEPASNVETTIQVRSDDGGNVSVRSEKVTSNEDGRAFFSLQTKSSAKQINVTVCPTKHHFHEEGCASAALVSYNSTVNAFVHIDQAITTTIYNVDHQFSKVIYVHPEQNNTVYYQVINRGKTLKHGKADSAGHANRQVAFRLTKEMAPQFRMIVYMFHKGHVVADSQDFKMEEACSPESEIALYSNLDGKEPGTVGDICIKGDPSTTVGLLAVDKAVYLISNAGQLTREKVLRTLWSHDLTCGPGGGVTSADVFADAGIVMMSRSSENTIMTENSCTARMHRHRRNLREAGASGYVNSGHLSDDETDVNSSEEYYESEPVAHFFNKHEKNVILGEKGFRQESISEGVLSNDDPFFQLCCIVGTLGDVHRRHCSTREEIIRRYFKSPRGHSCADAFARCCATSFGEPAIMDLPRARSNDAFSILSETTFEEPDYSQLQPRRDFMHTWLFEEVIIGADGWYNFSASTPHSVTTWSIEAVSLSPKGGVCVAKPVEAKAFKAVFLEVSFPPTVVRNEQVEVVATLFNYGSVRWETAVLLYGNTDLCIGSKHPKLPDRKLLNMTKNSAASVSFSVVPLRQGNVPIKVEVRSSGGSDLVEKNLVVVPEGIPVEESFSLILDPSNERRRKSRAVLKRGCRDILDEEKQLQMITITPMYPQDTVPHTEYLSVSVIGSEASSFTEAVISNVDSLISLPMGCGEQNMMIMAPVLYAYNYLKSKRHLNDTLAVTALKYVRKGYEQELTFRNGNGSFSTFQNGPENVWLTAFVLRVFCEARKVIDVSSDVIESGFAWLASQQHIDGSFKERDPILHRELLGSVHGTTAMTAFVLLTFHECASTSAPLPQEANVTIARASFYLREHLETIKHPYVAALTAYALSFVPGADRQRSLDVLKAHLLEDKNMNTLSTGNEATGVDVEGASYALLAHLKHRDMGSSKKIVAWLERHRSASGSFVSTQDTVVALQALSEFSRQASNAAPNISLSWITDKMQERELYHINRDSAHVLKEFDVIDAKGQIIINATGTGAAALNVRIMYNVLKPPEKICKFSLSVVADVDDGFNKSRREDFPSPLVDLLGVQKAYLSRHRVGRSAGQGTNVKSSKNTTYIVKACTRYLGGEQSDMAILDIGIFTGFSPVEVDLKKVIDDTLEAQKYERTEKSVIFYLSSITSAREICIAFRIQKDFAVTNLQTATVKVYDYYKPQDSCSRFYRPGTSSSVGLFCDGNQCKCATAECPVRETFEGIYKKIEKIKISKFKMEMAQRLIEEIACNEHDFVWRGKVVSKSVFTGYRHIEFEINLVIKEGRENASTVNGTVRVFQSRELCGASDLDNGREYIIFGKDSDRRATAEPSSIRYPLNHQVRIFDKKPSIKRPILGAIGWLSQKFVKVGCQL